MATRRLTFNEEIGGGHFSIPPVEESEEIKAALRKPLPLKSPWVMWLSGPGQYSVHQVVKFDTVQDFWSVWNGVPQPSELLEDKRFTREQPTGQTQAVDSFMIFREGIKPEWEDPANAKGGHLTISARPASGGGQIDEWWNNLILGMVGETIACSDCITGARLVDKIGGKGKDPPNIRFEIWYYTGTGIEEVSILKKSLLECLVTQLDGSVGQSLKGDQIVDKKH